LNISISPPLKRIKRKVSFRRLKSGFIKLNSLNFRFSTRGTTVSKRLGQYFKPLKTSFLNKGIYVVSKASEHLRCVIATNLKHYHSCGLGDRKKTMMTKRHKLPLDALQLTNIRISDRIPRNRGILQLGRQYKPKKCKFPKLIF